jgi:hypothetical protein
MAKQVFNFKEWGIGEWAAAASIAYLVYTAVRDNERAARTDTRESRAVGPVRELLVIDESGRVVGEGSV